MNEIDEIDRDALKRALVACRAESPGRAKQLDSKLRDEPWEEVAKFAAYSAQIEGLGLMPWQNPPIYAHSPISKSRLTIRAANARPPRF